MDESQRQAAAIKASISTYVATATLAVLAGALGLFTWITQAFTPPALFYVFMGAAVVLLVASIVVGGDGQDELVAKVANDEWKNDPINQFSWQSGLTLLALICVVVATGIGATSPQAPNPTKQQLGVLDQNVGRIDRLLTEDATLRNRVMALQAELAHLMRR
jgi:hypothetical protein